MNKKKQFKNQEVKKNLAKNRKHEKYTLLFIFSNVNQTIYWQTISCYQMNLLIIYFTIKKIENIVRKKYFFYMFS